MSELNLARIREVLNRVPEQFADKVAKVGWFPSAVYEDGTPVAYVAAIQENGAPEVSIPARPFVAPTVKEHSKEWGQLMGDGARAVLRGKTSADAVLEGVGMVAVGDIQATIEGGGFKPLSPTTILLRKWKREGRKITGSVVGEAAAEVAAHPELIAGVNADPLRDSGLMVATITSTVDRAD